MSHTHEQKQQLEILVSREIIINEAYWRYTVHRQSFKCPASFSVRKLNMIWDSQRAGKGHLRDETSWTGGRGRGQGQGRLSIYGP